MWAVPATSAAAQLLTGPPAARTALLRSPARLRFPRLRPLPLAAPACAHTPHPPRQAVRLVDDLTAAGLARLGISRQTLDANMLHWLNEATNAYLVRRGRAWCGAAAPRAGAASQPGAASQADGPPRGLEPCARSAAAVSSQTASSPSPLPATQFDWGSPEDEDQPEDEDLPI